MKILLFTLLCSIAGAVFTSSYAESNSAAIALSDAFFVSDVLCAEGDAQNADDIDTLAYVSLERYSASVYSIQFPAFNANTNSKTPHCYYSRAPPFFA